MPKMSNFNPKKGTKVETCSDEEGFIGAWYTATVITGPTKTSKKVTVQYDTLLTENGSKPLREKVDLAQIRPMQPRDTNIVFKLDDEVDAYHNDGWWEGVVTRVVDDIGKYVVYFRNSKEYFEFYGFDLRLHREWTHGNWVPPLVEEALPSEMDNHCAEEKPFSKGNRVEVSSDEDGFVGAWFAASVVEVLGKDKFLVEYMDLTTEDGTQFVREEVDAFHIRPCPPKAEKVDVFLQHDEVDALHNDGWWVGIISEVLGRSRYKVYFKTSNEEMEFKHDELRVHQEWTNGKWIITSEALNLAK